MLFMVIEKFRNQNPLPIYERLHTSGRMMPEGLTYIDSWIEPGFGRVFQLMETDDLTTVQQWIASWHDLMEFEIVPVVEGKTTREALAPLL